ncbi:MAG: NAD(+) synthase [Vicinamibacterales bacterium]
MHTRAQDIAEWLKERVASAGARGIVVGLSGGIDSAVVIGLAAMAVPGRVLGVVLPCHSDPQDAADARLAAAHFGVPTIAIDLAPAFDTLLGGLRQAVATLPDGQRPVSTADEVDIRMRVPVANVKPRLRMTSLYFVANSLNYLVAGTGNRSELTIGYFTKYGDGGVDLLPIGRMLKSEVRAIARELGVPAPIIEKPPSAGLWQGQTDETEMGFTYADLETYLTQGAEAIAPALALRIERLARASEHKRTMPPAPDEEQP